MWVFAPNEPISPGFPGFKAYYPGDEYAEAVAISGYHVGYCPSADPAAQGWQGPEATIGQYLVRMHALVPNKPMFIAQTGTTVYNSRDGGDNCHWAYYNKYGSSDDGYQFDGFRLATADPAYQYLSPEELMQDYSDC